MTLDDVLLGFVLLLGIIFVPWVFVIRPLLRRLKASAPVVNLADRRPSRGWSLRDELAALFLVEDARPIMSSANTAPAQNEAADARVSQPGESASAPTAMPSSAISNELTADETSARAIALLLNAGLLTNRTKAIEQVFHCSVTAKSRPDTPYQRALKMVEQYQTPARRELVGDMIARVEREVAAEQH